ncbi:substrate-binding periplasmic protein [Rhodoferax sp. WC2427]|uniref:substrate-binding periplasmic protein n=1 Tax=Rhodoferax sp. WC2427 TaxID=3234144 RepID=UPI0034650286
MRIPAPWGFLLRQLLPAAILACLAPTAWAADGCKQLVATGNPEYPPYLWRDGADGSRLVGANADLVQMVAQEIGIPIEVRYVGSWARVQEEARLGRIDLIAGAFFTVDRLDYMDYVYPAFRDTRSVVWGRQVAPLKYRQWSDLKSLSGMTVINNSFGEDFDRYAKKNLKINTVPSLEQAFKILQLGRVDYLVYEEDPGLAYIAKFAMAGLVSASVPVSNESLYLTLSHKSPCNTTEVRAALAKAMYSLARQGVMKKMVDSNIQLWRTK